MKYILYGEKGNYRLTTIKNYNSYIQDRNKITDFSTFGSVREILEYIAIYFNIALEDITIIAR